MRGDGIAATALAFCSAALGWNLLHGAPQASAGLPPATAESTWPNTRAALRPDVPAAAAEAPPAQPLPVPTARHQRESETAGKRGSALAPLLAQLRDPDSAQRELAVRALVDEDAAAAVPLLAYALADPEAAVVLAAIDVVQDRRELEVIDDLYLLLDHADTEVQRRAASAIRSLE